MKIAEILQAKDLRIHVQQLLIDSLEKKLALCKRDKKILKNKLKLD